MRTLNDNSRYKMYNSSAITLVVLLLFSAREVQAGQQKTETCYAFMGVKLSFLQAQQ